MLDQTYSSSFQVEQVVDQKLIDGETHFLVKWVGYDHSQNTWQPLRHMTHSKDKIKEWQQYKITQLNFASNKKLQEQLNFGSEKKMATRNSKTFKNVSNPYKKVYLRIDDGQDECKKKDLEEDKAKIKTIFDQPEMKRLIKCKKSERKKKELEIFEQRLKSRPKVWEKYLQDQDSVIKRANEKIKQVIDKAYGGSIKKANEKSQKQIDLTIQKRQTQKKASNNHADKDTPFSLLENEQKQKIITIRTQKPQKRQTLYPKTHQIIDKVIPCSQKSPLLPSQSKETNNIQKQFVKKTKIKVKNIFSSTQEDQEQTQQKHLPYQNKKMMQNIKRIGSKNIDSSIEQETNIISVKEKQQNSNQLFDKQNKDNQKRYTQEKSQKNIGNKLMNCQKEISLDRKIWVNDLIKGMVIENKKKSSSMEKEIVQDQKRKNLTIKPETILLTSSLIKNVKEKQKIKFDSKQQSQQVRKQQMSKISEESQRNECFSKISSISKYLNEERSQPYQEHSKILQKQINHAQDKQKQHEQYKWSRFIEEKQIQIPQQKILSQNQHQQQSITYHTPFQCSISSIDQILNKPSQSNSLNTEQLNLNLLIASKEQHINLSSPVCQTQGQKSSIYESSDYSQQISRTSSIINQELSQRSLHENQSQRIINYTTLTNHISTTIPQQQSQHINQYDGINFLNLIRQQSMSTRASEGTQIPLQINEYDSQNLQSDSFVNEPDNDQENSQNETSEIYQIKPRDTQINSINLGSSSLKVQPSLGDEFSKNEQNSHFQSFSNTPCNKASLITSSRKSNKKQPQIIELQCEKQPKIYDEVFNYFFKLQNIQQGIPSCQTEKNHEIELEIVETNKQVKAKESQKSKEINMKQKVNQSMNKSNQALSKKCQESFVLYCDFSMFE